MISEPPGEVLDLNLRKELFFDPERAEADNAGPFILVKDDFYDDPWEIRKAALDASFVRYSPPLSDQVGEEIASRDRNRPRWFSTALLRYHGLRVANPVPGFRYAPTDLREQLERVTGEPIDSKTWDDCGDWWNGAFHLQYAPIHDIPCAVHHHYRDGDLVSRGWSGVVFLTPDPPPDTGTLIARDNRTGLCVGTREPSFDEGNQHYEFILRIENRFNRLVLFRENVLHATQAAFGDTKENARLTQTLFFLRRG